VKVLRKRIAAIKAKMPVTADIADVVRALSTLAMTPLDQEFKQRNRDNDDNDEGNEGDDEDHDDEIDERVPSGILVPAYRKCLEEFGVLPAKTGTALAKLLGVDVFLLWRAAVNQHGMAFFYAEDADNNNSSSNDDDSDDDNDEDYLDVYVSRAALRDDLNQDAFFEALDASQSNYDTIVDILQSLVQEETILVFLFIYLIFFFFFFFAKPKFDFVIDRFVQVAEGNFLGAKDAVRIDVASLLDIAGADELLVAPAVVDKATTTLGTADQLTVLVRKLLGTQDRTNKRPFVVLLSILYFQTQKQFPLQTVGRRGRKAQALCAQDKGSRLGPASGARRHPCSRGPTEH
jgi:hypothetical protein